MSPAAQPTRPPNGHARKVAADSWYAVTLCEDDIVGLREAWIDPYLSGDMWLVRGTERDLLIDCGTGIVSPQPTVAALAKNPVLAVACNCWYDHAGGLHTFAERGCHRDDAAAIETPTPESSIASIYVSDAMLMALPHENYSASSYRMQGTPCSHLFDDGEVIDLGGRALQVIHVPGMTPGSIVLWEQATGSLFTSDTLFDDPSPELRRQYHQETEPSDPSQLTQRRNHLERLRELPVKTVYAGHFGRIDAMRMRQIIDAKLG
jgi:glyoxylase-like metal-dependent hydrolase (beta-lactamase superfamily II)